MYSRTQNENGTYNTRCLDCFMTIASSIETIEELELLEARLEEHVSTQLWARCRWLHWMSCQQDVRVSLAATRSELQLSLTMLDPSYRSLIAAFAHGLRCFVDKWEMEREGRAALALASILDERAAPVLDPYPRTRAATRRDGTPALAEHAAEADRVERVARALGIVHLNQHAAALKRLRLPVGATARDMVDALRLEHARRRVPLLEGGDGSLYG